MRAVVRSILGIALAATLAACSHGTSGVAPTGGLTGAQPDGQGMKFASAVPVCGPAGPDEARCFSLLRTDIPRREGLSPNAIGGYHPSDLIAAYGLPGGNAGKHQTIAVVDAFDDPNAEADLAVYRSTFGLPPCGSSNGCFRRLNEWAFASPLPPVDPFGRWEPEESLDVDMASAICPNCRILLIEAKSPSFPDLSRAVNSAAKHADVVSNSYGGNPANGLKWNARFNQPGHIIVASSGDDGFDVHFPAGSQYVVAVGGTHLTHSGNSRGWAETVWSGASSGCPKRVPKPAWQTDPLCSMRTIADVSAVADPATGVAMYDTYGGFGGWGVIGGTSVSSPIIAGVYALAGNEATLNYASSLYSAPAGSLWDVIGGSNGSCGGTYLCTGVAGYDGPSGNGTPNGVGAF
jgi:subtilase family serine protease